MGSHTWHVHLAVLDECAPPPPLVQISANDGQTREHLQEVIPRTVSARTKCLLLVGHNKGWEEATSELCGQPVRLKGAWAALLEGQGADWEQAFSRGKWELKGVLTPEPEALEM